MMLWRATFPLFLRALGVVSLFVLGVVVLAVSVEKADQAVAVLWAALRFQVLAVFVWLSPLITALAVALACLRLRSTGAERALACSGIGRKHMMPMAVAIGLIVGLSGIAAGEWLVPIFAVSDMPGWVSTVDGVVRTKDGLLVPANLLGSMGFVEHVRIGDAFPRLASFTSVLSQTSSAALTEQWARPSRAIACVGFAALALLFGRFRQPIVWVMAVCGVLTLIEVICWGLGAQNQLAPYLAGSFSAWGWVLPSTLAWRYSST